MCTQARTRTIPPPLSAHCSLWKAPHLPKEAGLMDISVQQSPNHSVRRPLWGSPTEMWPVPEVPNEDSCK